MTAQILDRTLTAYRLGDPQGDYPIFDATGSKLFPGRWNTERSPVVYASEHYSTSVLEKLIHGNGRLPPNQHWISISIPRGMSYEMFSVHHHPGWEDADCMVARRFGTAWYEAKRSLALLVPSVVARVDYNVLINLDHQEARHITTTLHQPVWWDKRLFEASATP